MLDSLVRVSRRVGKFLFTRNSKIKTRQQSSSPTTAQKSFTSLHHRCQKLQIIPSFHLFFVSIFLCYRVLFKGSHVVAHLRSPLSKTPPQKTFLFRLAQVHSFAKTDWATLSLLRQLSAYHNFNGFTSSCHPLSKVLFIFPSRYLFAIGFVPVFSFGWCLPPLLGCIPKQPDSSKQCPIQSSSTNQRDSHPL